jgi:putative ABC transport system ATP-binding protein
LQIAASFETPDAGDVFFGDVNLGRCTRRQLARLHHEKIGWVARSGPQCSELPMRVYVALPLYRRFGPLKAQRHAVATLARLGIADAADACWAMLPDSTRALIALAHALVREPQLLLVDDPTSGCGVLGGESIMSHLRSAAEDGGLGVLMAVPDMPAMLHAHEVRSLSRGRLLAPADRPPDGRGTVVAFPGNERSA